MLNASVKARDSILFISIVAPAENCGSYCCQRQLVCESSLYQFKNKKSFLIPIRGLNLGIVQMGTTKWH
jgi:hypothetical protein